MDRNENKDKPRVPEENAKEKRPIVKRFRG